MNVLYVWHTKMWIWKAAKMAGAACPTLKWQDRKTVGRAVPAIKLARLQHNSRSWCTAHIAATNHDIETDVKTGRFREDLLYRLNVIEVHTPPLRERPEDILRLARRFLAFFARSAGRPTLELSKAAEAALLAYPWPGNVRELRNAIERAVILWPAQVIEPQAFPESIVSHATSGPQLGGDFTLDTIEREHVIRVLARIKTLEEAAQILGIDSSTLWRKRKRYEE
jgi:NtrC-family two-component system response regulator AlgB